MTPDQPPQSSIILYQTQDGRTRIDCRSENETIWLTQALIAVLFDKDIRTINEHMVNIYEEGELERVPTIRRFRIVRFEGGREVAREIERVYLRVREILALAADYQPTDTQTKLVFQTIQNKLHFAATAKPLPN